MLNAAVATFELDLKKGVYNGYYSAPDGTQFQSAVYSALKKLQSLPMIDTNRIAVMGFSPGGEMAVHLGSQLVHDRHVQPGHAGFAEHIAFYPGCFWLFDPQKNQRAASICEKLSMECKYEGEPRGKRLLLSVGELDCWSDGTLCDDLAGVLNSYRPGMARVNIYPGAHHAFDLPGVNMTWVEKRWLALEKTPLKATVRYDKDTADQSSQAAVDFLKEVLF